MIRVYKLYWFGAFFPLGSSHLCKAIVMTYQQQQYRLGESIASPLSRLATEARRPSKLLVKHLHSLSPKLQFASELPARYTNHWCDAARLEDQTARIEVVVEQSI
jgi:hypothetical protein